MPRRTSKSPDGGIRISGTTLGVIVSVLVITGILYNVGKNVATRADVDSVKAAISPTLERHEGRIRDLEIQMASHFGASPTSTRTLNSPAPAVKAEYVLTQYVPIPPPSQYPPGSYGAPPVGQGAPPAIQSIPQRVTVVPKELIAMYQLQPTRGGTYVLLGEDGRYYSLDDVLAVIIRIHLAERRK